MGYALLSLTHEVNDSSFNDNYQAVNPLSQFPSFLVLRTGKQVFCLLAREDRIMKLRR